MFARRVSAPAFVFVVAVVTVLASARPAAADPADAGAIQSAIDQGVRYLKQEQKPTGYWGDGTGAGSGKGWGVGYTALAGITLLECDKDAKPTDKVLKRAAEVIRTNVNDIDSTYELALAILFLDRMNQKAEKKSDKDKRLIQLLAGRLITSQMPSGGWGYKALKRPESDVYDLLAVLRKMSAKPVPPAPPVNLDKLRSGLKDELKRLPVVLDLEPRLRADPLKRGDDLYDATTDNSNTHFAMLGLLAARAYDVPTDRTFARVARRFRTTQGPGGTWTYPYVDGGADGSPALTCVALLGLAIGHVFVPEPGVQPDSDPIILNAFATLSKSVGEPAGTTSDRPAVKDVGGMYFLWGMERIAVLYDLQKLGKKDWYQWGAEILVGHQLGDGSWGDDGGYPGQNVIPNTCLALLFLRRANLTPDLSRRLLVDPTVLTAQVETKLAPKPEPPPPSQKIVEPVPELAPPPHTPAPKVQPAPPPPPPAPKPEPVSEPVVAKKTPWLWIVLGTVVAGAAGGCLAFFLVAKRRKKDEEDEDEEDERETKPKAKKKRKVRVEEE
jgi:hypothetical protein